MVTVLHTLRRGTPFPEASGAATLLVAVVLATCSGGAPGEVGSMDPTQEEIRRSFAHTPTDVLDRALDVLVERGEMSAMDATSWAPTGRRTLADQGRVELTGASITHPADTLRTFVTSEQRDLVRDSGGRAWLTVRIARDGPGSATVGVTATIIATTPGPGPLGGRPVASNGTLERSFLDALEASLGAGR